MSHESIALPAEFIHNRIVLSPIMANGTILRILADTGGGCVLTPEAVARAGLADFTGMVGETQYTMVRLPPFHEAGWIPPLPDEGAAGAFLVLDRKNGPKGVGEDGIIGQAWFADKVWTFDYLNKAILYHEAGKSSSATKAHCTPLGFQQDGNGNRTYSFPRIQAVIDGETVDFLLDTGATMYVTEKAVEELDDGAGSCRGTCFITESMFMKWRRRNPHWRVIDLAEQGTGYPIIEVPEIGLAGYAAGPVWFTFRRDRDFHQFISGYTDRKVEGAVGGSALQYFRITADYPNALAYLER